MAVPSDNSGNNQSGSSLVQKRFQQGLAFRKKGNTRQARKRFEQVLKLQPKHLESLLLLGADAYDNGDLRKATNLFRKATKADPKNAAAYFNLGVSLSDQQEHKAAIQNYDKAIKIDSSHANAYNNRGVSQQALGQYQQAVLDHKQAIHLNAEHMQAYNNLGMALEHLSAFQLAARAYEEALKLNPDQLEVLNNHGNALAAIKQYDKALQSYDRAMVINPDYDFLQGARLHARMQLCDWQDFEQETQKLVRRISQGEKAASPLTILALCDSLELHQATTKIWSRVKNPNRPAPDFVPGDKNDNRIRIGYFSADFRNHPVAYLTAELFERHNREQFEVIGFYYGPETEDEMYRRVSCSFDQFFDVKDHTDEDIARLSRDMGVDIAIDLGGYTEASRAAIFACRAAPIQASYLGYLGTMSTDAIDYLFADKTIVPEPSQQFYSEKIVYLPSYQINDSLRTVADKVFSRGELGLPETGFVFCCFNNPYKITPPTFDGWMRILGKVQSSVLFLLSNSQICRDNLRREASMRGIDPARLVFGEHLPRDEYLARYKVADLFLDTLPYNAGTTASDALWVGLPVLTCQGESFASRVAASLLEAIGLPQLVTTSAEDYEALAIHLASHPQEMSELEKQLQENKLTTALFDTPETVHSIESAFTEMYQQYLLNGESSAG